jgi:hypothetical protein
MAQSVGQDIIQAAQQINQQIMTQNQMALQQSRFAQQVQAAEESVRLREQNLELQQKKVDLDTKIAEQNQDLKVAAGQRSAEAGARSERAIAVQEGQLDLRLDQLKKTGEEAAKLANTKAQAEIDLINTRAKGLGLGPGPAGRQTQNQELNTMLQMGETIVYSTPEFKAAAGATPEEIEKWGAFGATSIKSMIKSKSSVVAQKGKNLAFATRDTPSVVINRMFGALDKSEKELKELQAYDTKLSSAAANAVFLDPSEGSTKLRDEIHGRMADVWAATPAQLQATAEATLRGEVPTAEEAYSDLVPQFKQKGASFDTFKNAFVGDFTDPTQVALSANQIVAQLPEIKTPEEYDIIGPQINAFSNSLEVPLSAASLERLHQNIRQQLGLTNESPAR